MKIISLKETAARLDVSVSTLKRLIADKKIRKVQITERRVGCIESEIDELITGLADQDAA